MQNNKVQAFSDQLKDDLPGFIAFSVCQIKTGKCVFSVSVSNDFDIDFVTRANVDFVRAKLNVVNITKINDTVKSIVVHLEHQYHVIEITPDNSFFFYLAVDRDKTNIAIVLAKLKKFKKIMSES